MRYAISRVETVEIPGLGTLRRGAAQRYPAIRSMCLIAPGTSWCLLVFEATNYAPWQTDPDVRLLPEGLMDAPLSNPQRNNIQNNLDALGVELSIANASTLREVVHLLAIHQEPDAPMGWGE